MFSSNTTQVSNAANYIEDVFSTYLYTGNGSTQTITNGIDLSTKGGLVWLKQRTAFSGGFDSHCLVDTLRGAGVRLQSDLTDPQYSNGPISAFTSSGFSLNIAQSVSLNENGNTIASWTFRKQPKFFDVVTYTGNGVDGRTISHNLGATPGCVIVKRTDSTGDWVVRHTAGGGINLLLNTTVAGDDPTTYANGNVSGFSSTTFTVSSGTTINAVNANGATYVAYLFAHDAGGFGLTGTDNVISCGSYTGNGSSTGPTITLGYEPQWVLIKNTSDAYDWQLYDVMRGMANSATGSTKGLSPNTSAAEVSRDKFVFPTATGFGIGNGTSIINQGGGTMIYIAIRRGPMKVPTSGTSVFELVTSTSANFIKGTLEASDMGWFKDRATVANWFVGDRLRGIMSYYNRTLYTNLTNAEATPTTGDTVTSTSSEGTGNGKIYFGGAGATTDQPLGYSFRRAPSFFDEVCLSNNTGGAVKHNLGVVPELVINKARGTTGSWRVACSSISGILYLETTDAKNGTDSFQTIVPCTSTTVNVDGIAQNTTNVTYLFATCAGVSKVGSYTGTGASGNAVTTGFAPRFLMIKVTTTTGGWIVFDSARGIGVGNDPYLYLNSTAAEATGVDWVDVSSSGFSLNTTGNATNGAGETYIYLAIA